MRDKHGKFVKGHSFTTEMISKIKCSLKGRMSWNKGKKMSEKYRLKLKIIKKDMAKKGQLRGLYTKENGKGREKTFFKKNHEVHWKMLYNRKSKNENYLETILVKNNFPYKFVGNGSVIFDRINPDFINCNGKKKIIELQSGITKEWKDNRNRIFEKYGYSWLLIPLRELKSNPNKVIEKIRCFDEK